MSKDFIASSVLETRYQREYVLIAKVCVNFSMLLGDESKRAFGLFKNHIYADGFIKGLILHFFFYFGRLPLVSKAPIIGRFIKLSTGLFYGYISETNFKSPIVYVYDDIRFRNHVNFSDVFDYIIIGSGPGAATAYLKITDKRVLIIESGTSPQIGNFDHHSLLQVANKFNRAGQELIFGFPQAQFTQGKVMGGGSELNSGLYHELPDAKINEFCARLNVSVNQFKESEQKVKSILSPNFSFASVEDSIVARGAKKLGLDYAEIPRWRSINHDKSIKQHGMFSQVWSKHSENPGLSVLTSHEVVRINTHSDNYIEVISKNEYNETFSYRAKKLILSAGTVTTPFLLAKSGLIKWKDINFQWHPMFRLVCKTNPKDLGFDDIDPFQAWTSDHSLKFGSAVSTPGLLAMNLNRSIDPEDARNFRSYYVSTVSSGRGGLIPNTKIPFYRFSKADLTNSKRGLQLLSDLVGIAGANMVDTGSTQKKPSTVHIFGSLPADSGLFVAATSNLQNDERIKVADGSLLPFGPGVNPQAIIMSTVDALFKS